MRFVRAVHSKKVIICKLCSNNDNDDDYISEQLKIKNM